MQYHVDKDVYTVYSRGMAKRKPLSMLRLHKMTSAYIATLPVKKGMESFEAHLKPFIQYIWDHKDDNL